MYIFFQDMKNLTEDSFLFLYDIYLRNCKLYVIGLIEDVNNKHFCTEEEKMVYIKIKKGLHLTIIQSLEVEADCIKSLIESKKYVEDVNKEHEEMMERVRKYTNYDKSKAEIDYLKKVSAKLK